MKKTSYIFATFALSIIFFGPMSAQADNLVPATQPQTSGFDVNNQKPGFDVNNVPTTASKNTAVPSLPNPLGDKVGTIPQLIYKLVQALVDVSYVVIAFFLILSGFKFVMAQGSDDKLTAAKNTFFNTIIGAVIIIGAQVIVSVAQSIFASLK